MDTDTAKGLFVVIEGSDGTGKTTQYERLKRRLEREGYEVVDIHFPQYEHESSYFVRQYLAGEYGGGDEVGPYTASLFYALDRYAAAAFIRQALAEGKVVLCDRYVGSDMAHQGTKFDHAEERRGYFVWLDNLEFQTLRIPRPHLNLVLDAPYGVVLDRLREKHQADATKQDIHETDIEHVRKSLEVYRDLTGLFPKDFTRIDSVRRDGIANIDTIADDIWQTVRPQLPPKLPRSDRKRKPAAKVPTAGQAISKSKEDAYIEAPAGEAAVLGAVTNANGNVYAFTHQLSSATIAASVAELCRGHDDVRESIAGEFAQAAGRDAELQQRAVSSYGDESVRQLVGQYVMVENASGILAKKLEYGRLAAYLEQPAHAIAYDQKNSSGHYRYYTPKNFSRETRRHYHKHMNLIFERYIALVRELTNYIRQNSPTPAEERGAAWEAATRVEACRAAQPVLPIASTTTVGIYASVQSLEQLIVRLMSDELPEARATGQHVLAEVRKVIPAFMEQADDPDHGGALMAYRARTRAAVGKFASEHLPAGHSPEAEAVQLSSVWPRNELDLVPDLLYEHSSLPLHELEATVAEWPYDRKLQAFQAYLGERFSRRHRPGRAFEKAHYSWDIVCDYGVFRDLQRHRMVDDLEWQALTPRYGYDIPQLVEDAGLADVFEECFELSLQLYSYLQQGGYIHDAQYATLLGHKLRWKLTYNAREAFHIHELHTRPGGNPGCAAVVRAMHERLAEVHPLIAGAMIFMNKGDDPELTRMAAERYLQYKHQQLS